MRNQEIIAGIDESGRGPLAGSMFVCGVSFTEWDPIFDKANDSKKLSEKKRFELAREFKQTGKLLYKMVEVSANEIDTKGISVCMNEALSTIKEFFNSKGITKIIFDGNTSYKVSDIETMVKGDQKVKEISIASIFAKCAKDAEMLRLSTIDEFSEYGFAQHKGYGTVAHIEAIKRIGLSSVHRKTFCTKLSLS